MPISAQALSAALKDRGYRAEALRAGRDSRVSIVNVWCHGRDRRPVVCVWEPFENDGWQWGEHEAPGDISAAELADRVIDTLR